MIEVLEHTPTAFQTAGEVYRVLKPGGVWVVSVPNPYHFKEIIWNLLDVPPFVGHAQQIPDDFFEMIGIGHRNDPHATRLEDPVDLPRNLKPRRGVLGPLDHDQAVAR